jgi:hypothetical protein
MDCQGAYLTDETNKRIRIEEDQLYFLAQNGLTVNKLS